MSLQDLLDNSMTARQFYLLSDEEIYKCEWLKDDGEWYGMDPRAPLDILLRHIHNLRQGAGQLDWHARLIVRVATSPLKTSFSNTDTKYQWTVEDFNKLSEDAR